MITMDFPCCATGDGVDETIVDTLGMSPDRSNSLVSSSFSHDTSDKSEALNCDYRDVTPLFRAIEQEDWSAILIFLKTGKWDDSPLRSSIRHLQSPIPQVQARTWVTSTNRHGEVQWSQLPIHAATSYMAPFPVIQKLVELHPQGVRSADDTGNLPLHLAFGFGSPDNVILFLLQEFPQALGLRGLQDRLPVECSDLGSGKLRGDIILACQEHTRSSVMKEWDHNWKRSLGEAKKRARLTQKWSTEGKTLDQVFDELIDAKIELDKAKEFAISRPTMIITKTEPATSASASLPNGKLSYEKKSKRFDFNSNDTNKNDDMKLRRKGSKGMLRYFKISSPVAPSRAEDPKTFSI